jgi:hypothetical protein
VRNSLARSMSYDGRVLKGAIAMVVEGEMFLELQAALLLKKSLSVCMAHPGLFRLIGEREEKLSKTTLSRSIVSQDRREGGVS